MATSDFHTQKINNRTKDVSVHGLLVALGMAITVAAIVIIFAIATSDEASFKGILEYFTVTLTQVQEIIEGVFASDYFEMARTDLQVFFSKLQELLRDFHYSISLIFA